ncbi:MAG: hypothetical protein ACT4O3_00740, partial [Elusimicrobiota bacterium]
MPIYTTFYYMHPASLLPQIRNPKSLLALILAGVYFYTNVAAAHAAEKSFWEQRRAAVKELAGSDGRKNGPAAEAYQTLARLPAAPVALGLHATAAAPGAMPAPQSLSRERGLPLPADVRSLPTWLSQVVLPFGTVREIYLAKDPAAPLIVHIQDVHGHYEAQKNMARILQGLAEERGIGLIGLEGAEGGFVTGDIRASADKAALERASEDFLKRGLLGGPEHIALTAAKELTLWGSEDTPLYLDNIRAVKESLRLKPEGRRRLEIQARRLDVLKEKIYSPGLKAYDRRAAAYREKKEDLGTYVGYLLSAHAKTGGRSPASYPNLRLLRDALRREKSLDFAAVEKERLALIEELAARADEASLNGLVQQSLLYRMGRMSYGDYYEFLRNLCARHKISLSAHPRLASYIDYVKAAEKIHRENLLKELDALEESLGDRLADGDAQKRLLALDRDHALLDRLLNLEMTPEAWAKYEARRADVLRIPSRLREWTAGPAAGPEPAGEELLRPFEDFCRAAIRRNEALSRNILARMKAEKIPAAVLVAGGFHTEGLTDGFKRSGVSYAVVTPRVEGSLDASKNYLDVFARDPLPLEKLIAGEPISLLYPRALAATAPPDYAKHSGNVQTALRRNSGAPGSAPVEGLKTAAKFSAAAVTMKTLAAQAGRQFASFVRAVVARLRSFARSHPAPTAGLVTAAALILLYNGSQLLPAAVAGWSFALPILPFPGRAAGSPNHYDSSWPDPKTLETILAFHRQRTPFSSPFGQELQDLVDRWNQRLHEALRRSLPQYPFTCEAAAALSGEILLRHFQDRAAVEIHAGRFIRRYGNEIHYWAIVTDKSSGDRYYLGFLDGQFAEYPGGSPHLPLSGPAGEFSQIRYGLETLLRLDADPNTPVPPGFHSRTDGAKAKAMEFMRKSTGRPEPGRENLAAALRALLGRADYQAAMAEARPVDPRYQDWFLRNGRSYANLKLLPREDEKAFLEQGLGFAPLSFDEARNRGLDTRLIAGGVPFSQEWAGIADNLGFFGLLESPANNTDRPKPAVGLERIAAMNTDDLFAFLQSDAARAYHRAAVERFPPEEGGEAGYSRYIWSVARNNMPAAYFRVLRALLQHGRLDGGARILEIGPGPGSFVHLLTSLGLEAEGLEREKAFIRYGNDRGAKMIHGNILSPPAHMLDAPYDVTVGHLVLDALTPSGPEASYASRLEEFQALIHISRLTKTGGVSIQEVDPSSDLPFSDEEFRMAGFEVAENPHGAFVVLRKIGEPASLGAFSEYLKERGDEPARPGNSRVGWWMFWQNGAVDGVVEFLEGRLVAGSPLTAQRLLGWLKADPVLARQMNSGRWRVGESRAVQEARARKNSGSWLWYKDWRYPTWSLRDYARERGWKEESIVSSAVGAVMSAVLLLFGQSPTASLYASAIATAGFFLAGHVADLFFPSHRKGLAGRIRVAAILVLAASLPLMLQILMGMAHPAFASLPAASAAYALSVAIFLRGHYRVNHREDEPPSGERLKNFLRGHIGREPGAAVVFGDLTNMRVLNNLYGRRTVDGLMQGVLAAVFKEFKKQNPLFRKHTAGRQGGDEFIGVLYPRNGDWPGAGLQAIKDAAASFDARTAARYGFGRFEARGLTEAQWERIQKKTARRLNRPRRGRGLAGIHNTRAGWTVVYNREGRDLSTAYLDAIRWLNAEAAKAGGSVEPLPDFTVPLRAPGVSLGAFVPDPAAAPGERDLDQELAAADQSRQESRLSRAEDGESESTAGARGKKHSMRPLTYREKALLAEKRQRLEILGEQAGLPAQALAASVPAFGRSYLGRYLSRRSGPTQVIKIQMQYRFPVDIRRELLQIFLTMTRLRGHGEYSGGKGVNEVLDHETMDMFIARTAMEIDSILLRRSREEDALFLGRPDEFFVVTGRPMSEDDLTGLADRIQVAAQRQFQNLFPEDTQAETHVRVTMTVAESNFGPARPDREEIQDLLDRVALRSALPAQHSHLHDLGRGIQELATHRTKTVIRFSHAEDRKTLEERITASSIAMAYAALDEFRRLYSADGPEAPPEASRETPARDDILEPWGLRPGLSPRFALGYDVLISLAEEGLFRYGALAVLPPLLVSGGLPIPLAQAVGLLAAGPAFLFAHTISRWLAARRRGEDWRWGRELKKDFLSPLALRRLSYSLPFVIFPTLNIPIAAAFLVSSALHFRTERRASEPPARPLTRFGLFQRVSSRVENALSQWRRLAGSTAQAAKTRPALTLAAALAAFAAFSILHGGSLGSGASFSMAVVLLAAPSPTKKTDGAAALTPDDAASRRRPFDWSEEEIESGLPRFPFETWIFREFSEDGRSIHISVHDSPLIVPSTKVFALNLSVDPDAPRTVRLGPGALQEHYNDLYPHGHKERLSMTRWMTESFHPWMARSGFERIAVTVLWGRSAEFFGGLEYKNDPRSPNTMIKTLTSDDDAARILLPNLPGEPRGTPSHFPEGQTRQGLSDRDRGWWTYITNLLNGRPYGAGSEAKNQLTALLRELDDRNEIGSLVLDLGSGETPVSQALAPKPGRAVVGVDAGLSRPAIYREDASLPTLLIEGDIQDLDSTFRRRPVRGFLRRHVGDETASFQTIILSDILNYVDYRRVLQDVRSRLSPGGRLVIMNMAVTGVRPLLHEQGVKSNAALAAFLQSDLGLVVQTYASPEMDRDDVLNSSFRQILVARRETVDEALTRMSRLQDNTQKISLAREILGQIKLSLRGQAGDLHLKQLRLQSISLVRLLAAMKSRQTEPLLLDILRLPFRGRAAGVAAESLRALSSLYESERRDSAATPAARPRNGRRRISKSKGSVCLDFMAAKRRTKL